MNDIVVKVIFLDGVGLNLKTSLMNMLEDDGFVVLRSDSHFYWGSVFHKFPFNNKFTTKIRTRYAEIATAVDIARAIATPIGNVVHVFVDRGLINQCVWARLNKDEIVDRYINDEADFGTVLCDDFLKTVNMMEQSFNCERLLISTHSKQIIRNSLDPNLYDKDPHAAFRIDTFYDEFYYPVVRDNYEKFYQQYALGNCEVYKLDDEDGTIPEQLEGLYNFVYERFIK